MSDRLVLPRLSDTMEEGAVVRWLKQPGDAVAKGEPLVEIDTEKVTVVLDSPNDGFLGRILVPEGATTRVGATLVQVVSSPALAASTEETLKPEPAETRRADRGAATPVRTTETRTTRSAEIAPPLRATPLARKRAREAGVDIAALAPGSGPNGRVLGSDVERVLASATARDRSGSVVQPSRLHALVARRMSEAKQQIPHYYVTTEADVTAAQQLRRDARLLDPPLDVSLTDLVTRACALALTEETEVNSSWIDGKIVRHAQVNVGIAVSLEDGGLVVPVIQDANRLTIAELAARVAELTANARSGTLTPVEVDRGTFTISNLGMFNVDEFHAIINPHRAASSRSARQPSDRLSAMGR